jgi:hypothetical protein
MASLNMIVFLLALGGAPSSTCPMTIGVNSDGTIYSSRFYGWYKTSSRTLDSDLRYGCYNDANPTAVTPVMVLLAPAAPKTRVDLAFSILAKDGWRRDKVSVKLWDGKPLSTR